VLVIQVVIIVTKYIVTMMYMNITVLNLAI